MSYRDDLANAHQRIAQLENELRDERAKVETRTANADQPAPPESLWAGIKPILGGGLLAAVVLAAMGIGISVIWNACAPTPTPTMLVKRVDEVVRDQAQYRKVPMRVEGRLLPGTTSMRETPCEVSMVLERANVLLTVHMAHCTLPDAFRADASVDIVAEGELRPDGIFEAKQILVAAAKL